MLGDIKNKILDANRGTTTTSAIRDVRGNSVPSTTALEHPSAAPDTPSTVSTIAKGMTIVGNINCDGVLQIFGRIEGELRGTTVVIGDGAQFEGSVIAQDLTVDGQVKGTIHANRVKLRSTAKVHGDIFHRSLSIEENAQFDGSSRREENPAQTATPARTTAGASLPPEPEALPVNGAGTPVLPISGGIEHTSTQ